MDDHKQNVAILIAASIIAAVRLNKEEIKNTPRVQARIADSIQLARMIWQRIAQDRKSTRLNSSHRL